MNGPDCPECGEHFTDCKCNKKKRTKKQMAPKAAAIASFGMRYGNLREIPDEELHRFLEDNETHDAAFLAIVCSEVLRRQCVHKAATKKFIDDFNNSGL